IRSQMGLRFPQQIARIDTISRKPIGQFIEAALVQRLQTHIEEVDAILISDYQNGLLSPHLISLVKQVSEGKAPIIVDTQGALDKYHGVDVVKCNADDAAEFLNAELHGNDDFADAARELANRLLVKTAVVITRGAEG